MNKIIKNSLKGIVGTALICWFTGQVVKSHYEPNYFDSVIQYKASTVSPVYSGFDTNKDGEIDSINVYRAHWIGYQNYNLVEKDAEFSKIKETLNEQLKLEQKINIYSGERTNIWK
jgi:hypothetical protein